MGTFKNILVAMAGVSLMFGASYALAQRGAINTHAGFDESCRQCVSTYCSIECNGTGSDCGLCIQKWCSYEC